MTPVDAFAAEVRDNLEPPEGMAQFDPITLVILMTAISTVVAHYVERWLQKCEAKTMREPGSLAIKALEARCWIALHRHGSREIAGDYCLPLSRAILKTLREKSEEQITQQWAGMKGQA